MSEFEIQQLIMSTRWEFDVPQMMFFLISIFYIAFCIFRSRSYDWILVRSMQISYLFVSAFLLIRAYAAMVRGRKLYEVLSAQDFLFEFNNPPVQITTLFFRVGAVVALVFVTLYVLNRSMQPKSSRIAEEGPADHR